MEWKKTTIYKCFHLNWRESKSTNLLSEENLLGDSDIAYPPGSHSFPIRNAGASAKCPPQANTVTKAYIASQACGEIFQPNLFMAAKHTFIVVHLGTHLSVKPEW